ncbi:MAG TPA: hypothetical protein ENK19_07700 [Acidobacteria bacterium]|nr:hypothetical protein [Acidobacteriota bacterium]
MSGPLTFPGRLRPATARRTRRVRRRVLAATALAGVITAGLLLWRVGTVSVSAFPGFPDPALRSLRSLEGTPVVLLSLREARRLAAVWPGVASVEARLELPGRLAVTVHRAAIAGCVPTGRGWHAVGNDGALGLRLRRPVPPVLQGFAPDPDALREGLAVARRVTEESGRSVVSVRRILPGDLEIELADDAKGTVVVHVRPEPSGAERWWMARLEEGRAPGTWADLRRDDRLTVGGAG